MREWRKRRWNDDFNWISLGGLKMRSEDEMRRWLAELQQHGLMGLSATFVGHGAVHDRWNGRRGDFDFMMRTIRAALDLGLEFSDQHILIKSSLPIMLELFHQLEELMPSAKTHHVRMAYYNGHGAHREDERMTELERDTLPDRIAGLLNKHKNTVMRSEREWVEFFRTNDVAYDVRMRLEITTANIDRLEEMSLAEIFAGLEERARATLSSLPSMPELAERYGDLDGRKIYNFHLDLDRYWLNRYLQDHPIEYDNSLLHFHLGRSLRPPRVWELVST